MNFVLLLSPVFFRLIPLETKVLTSVPKLRNVRDITDIFKFDTNCLSAENVKIFALFLGVKYS